MSSFDKEVDCLSEGEGEFSPEDEHPPLSPATGAESLFLAGLATSSISARALSEQLRKNSRSIQSSGSVVSSVFSVATDDFATAVECENDIVEDQETFNFFGKDSKSIPEIDTEEDSFDDEDSMAKTSTRAPTTIPASTKPPAKVMVEPKFEIDAAEKIYEGAKDAWAWGKGVMVVSPFLGMAEGIASKVVQVAGTDLESLDGQIKPHLSKLDEGILNPAIDAVVGIVLGAVGKSEEILKPIIKKIFVPFGLIKEEGENPEVTAN